MIVFYICVSQILGSMKRLVPILVLAVAFLAQGCKHRPVANVDSYDSYSGATEVSPLDATSDAAVPTSPATCEEAAVVAVPLDAPEEIDLVGDIMQAAANRDPRGNFILEGDFKETGQIYCGLQQTGSYAPIYLHLEIYENVMYLTYSGGSRQELPLCKTDDDGLSRHYQMGPSQQYIYMTAVSTKPACSVRSS